MSSSDFTIDELYTKVSPILFRPDEIKKDREEYNAHQRKQWKLNKDEYNAQRRKRYAEKRWPEWRDKFSRSETFQEVKDHRSFCPHWGKRFCLGCFGGGLEKFFENIILEFRGGKI